jgi:hypothetical protein
MPETLLLIGGVLTLFVVVYFVARNEIVRRRLTCPRSGRIADVEVKRRFEKDKDLHVKSCDQLEDPENVTCEEECIHRETTRT